MSVGGTSAISNMRSRMPQRLNTVSSRIWLRCLVKNERVDGRFVSASSALAATCAFAAVPGALHG